MQRLVDSRPAYPPEYDCAAPECCVECAKPLDIETQDYFCGAACERAHIETQRAADNAYAAAIAEEDRIATEYQRLVSEGYYV